STIIYGADSVAFSYPARKKMEFFEKLGYDKLAVCMAKTPYSLSDDPKLLGVPRHFKIKVSDIRLAAGAGFIIPITGDITTMPGLPRIPAAVHMDIEPDGKIKGLF
ncbi:MAG TPA: formate--tetrahydrofolate ligase, partial [Euryarchaeota archaeon]|nr:formate--tetrahydrofolate ligase [Euryarchaeota archaeon]